MKKILFVCLGNICRSPMAEFVMKDMVAKAGAGERFVIDSAATSTEELGNPVYPPARRELAAHGVVCGPHTARQMTRADYDSTTPPAPAMWPTRGTRETFRPPGGTLRKAAAVF